MITTAQYYIASVVCIDLTTNKQVASMQDVPVYASSEPDAFNRAEDFFHGVFKRSRIPATTHFFVRVSTPVEDKPCTEAVYPYNYGQDER